MDDQEILKHLRKSAWEDVKFFSNSSKEENKIDVSFHNAQFQVKELTDPNFKRGKMYKDTYNSIKEATTLEEISLPMDTHDIPPISNMYELILEKARELANSKTYNTLKNEIDLLIYVTRTRASLIQAHEIKSEELSALGWRSISCVNSKQAVVLHSTQSAPKFIIEKEQQVISNKA